MKSFCDIIMPDLTRLPALLEETRQKQLSNGGPLYKLFNEKMGQFLKTAEDQVVTLTSSGHTALMAAYHVSGCKRLLMPSYTFESTRLAASSQGINAIPVDVDAMTLCLEVSTIEHIDPETYDAVVAVCALSSIPNLEKLRSFCDKHGKKLIVDAAAAFGTPDIVRYGHFTCYSFHATKSFPLGEGGCVISSAQDRSAIWRFINFGLDANRVPSGYGINGKVSDYTAGIGILLLEDIPKHIAARKDNALRYRAAFGDDYCAHSWKGDNTVFQCFPLSFSEHTAKLVREALIKKGVDCKQYYVPISKHENANALFAGNVSIPCHSSLTTIEVEEIIDIVSSVIG